MEKILKSRIASFLAVLLIISVCFTAQGSYKAYAAYVGPQILITEIMPMSQSTGDAYEYIELYNNSDQSVDLKDYKLPYQNIDLSVSKVLPPRGIMVVCTASTTTLEAFNAFYGLSLTEDKYMTLPSVGDLLINSGDQRVLISEDDGLVVSRASFDENDFDVKKSITYKYPSSGFDMTLLGTKQVPTPGTIEAAQVPDSGIRVTGITLDKQYITMEVYQTVVLHATVIPATATNKTVLWTSADPSIVSVDTNGVLSSKKDGFTVITAKTEDGGYTASCAVLVSKIPVTGVALDRTNVTLNVGQAVILTPIFSPEDATNQKVTWKSSDSDVAAVDSKGLVKGKSDGTAVITVKTVDGGFTASCTVRVKNDTGIHVTGVTLDKTNATLEIGDVIVLEATVTPYNAVNKNVSWSSSNTAVAKVDQSGVVTALKEGSSLITVKTNDGGYTDSCLVTVKDKTTDNPVIMSLRLNRPFIQLRTGNSHRIVPIIVPGNAKNIKLVWKTSNDDVAMVTPNGWVIGISEGYAVITVSTPDGKYSAECIAYVRNRGRGGWRNW